MITVYTYVIEHPKFGDCGGDVEDKWTIDPALVERHRKECRWPTRVVSKQVTRAQWEAMEH